MCWGLYRGEGSQAHTVLWLLQEQKSTEPEGDAQQKAQGGSQACWGHMCALHSFGIWCTFESDDFFFFVCLKKKKKYNSHIVKWTLLEKIIVDLQ